MAPTTLEPKRTRRIIPVRACRRCNTIEDVFHLTMVEHLWLCRECHRSLSFAGSSSSTTTAEPQSSQSPQSAQLDSVATRLNRIDRSLRWGGFALRIVIYAVFLLLASEHPLVEDLLFGFFLADSLGWVLHAWSDAHFHGRAITAEAVFYTLLFLGMQSSGMLDLPSGIEAGYLAGGTAALTFGWQFIRFWYKLRIAQPD